MKKQINPTIKAHLIRGAFYLLLLIAVCVIPFALAQRNTTATTNLAAAGAHSGVPTGLAGTVQRPQRRPGAVDPNLPYDIRPLPAQAPKFPYSSIRDRGPSDQQAAAAARRVSRLLRPIGVIRGFSENFDSVTPPTLPPDWTATNIIDPGDGILWQTSDSGDPSPPADSPPNAAWVNDAGYIADKELDSLTFTYTPGAQLTFRQNYDLEQFNATLAYDCGLLEISFDNGATFNEIIAAGGSFVTGGYDHTDISAFFLNPCMQQYGDTQDNWSGLSNGGADGFQTTTVDLPAAGVGQPVKLRWRECSDDTVSHAGWRVDNVTVTYPGGTPTPTPTATPTATPSGCTINGSIDAGDPTQIDRLFRSGIPQTCPASTTCDVFGDPTPRHYDAYTFTNTTGATQCVTVDTNTACTTNFIFIAAYLGSFDPNNICNNWIGDSGSSPNPEQAFSFDVDDGQTFVLVVSEVTPEADCPSYTLTIAPETICGVGTPTPTPTPTPEQITLNAAGRKVNGVDTVRLTWSGATSNQVDIYRCVQQLNGCDPAVIATTGNDGRYIDSTGHTGQAGFRYKVCEAGTRTCSKTASVTFER